MSTVEKLEELLKKHLELNNKLLNLEANFQKNLHDNTKNYETIQKKLDNIYSNYGKTIKDVYEDLNKKFYAMEASLTSTLSILEAVIKLSEKNNLFTGSDVMVCVRQLSEEKERAEVTSMLDHGLIVSKDVVEMGDLVFVAESLRLDSGEVKTLSEYRRVDLSVANTPKTVMDQLVGRKKDESYEYVLPDNKGTYITKVVGVYCLAEKNKQNNREEQA